MNLKDRKWTAFKEIVGLPSISVTAIHWMEIICGWVAPDTSRYWTWRKRVPACYIQTGVLGGGVNRIQIGGGYVWAQFDWHLYRAALSGL